MFRVFLEPPAPLQEEDMVADPPLPELFFWNTRDMTHSSFMKKHRTFKKCTKIKKVIIKCFSFIISTRVVTNTRLFQYIL